MPRPKDRYKGIWNPETPTRLAKKEELAAARTKEDITFWYHSSTANFLELVAERLKQQKEK